MKLTWHKGAGAWSKIIGKKLDKSGNRLVQAQHYFTSNRDESAGLAASIVAEWKRMKLAWKIDHEPHLRTLDDKFASIPHWYESSARGSLVTAASMKAIRDESNHATADEIAYEHRDETLSEIAGRFIIDRRQREGIDFKATTNKTYEDDLHGFLRFIDDAIVTADLTPEQFDQARLKMMKDGSGLSKRSVRNRCNAFKMMLEWYWPLFTGSTPNNFDAVFAKIPKRKNATPAALSLPTLKTVFDAANPRRRMFLLLMVNCGMQPTDIAAVQANAFDLKAKTVTWKREKNETLTDPSDVVLVSRLWPETIALVRKFIAKTGHAFRKPDREPMTKVTAGRNRNNAVAKSLNKLFKRLADDGIDVSAKTFRQMGSQLIQNHGGDDLSRLWLGRNFNAVDRSYLPLFYTKLDAAVDAAHAELKAAKVF